MRNIIVKGSFLLLLAIIFSLATESPSGAQEPSETEVKNKIQQENNKCLVEVLEKGKQMGNGSWPYRVKMQCKYKKAGEKKKKLIGSIYKYSDAEGVLHLTEVPLPGCVKIRDRFGYVPGPERSCSSSAEKVVYFKKVQNAMGYYSWQHYNTVTMNNKETCTDINIVPKK